MNRTNAKRIVQFFRMVVLLVIGFLIASGITLLVMKGATTKMGPLAFVIGGVVTSLLPVIKFFIDHNASDIDLQNGIGLGVCITGVLVGILSTFEAVGFFAASTCVFTLSALSVVNAVRLSTRR